MPEETQHAATVREATAKADEAEARARCWRALADIAELAVAIAKEMEPAE